MAIEIECEPAELWDEPAERCALCNRQTRYWCRQENVPVCPGCASEREPWDLHPSSWMDMSALEGEGAL